MKKNFAIIALALIFNFPSVYAQSVDDIVAANITAMGGKDKLASLKTVKMTGTMNVQGTDVNLSMLRSHLTGWRLDLEIMGTSNYQMVNKTQGWVYMPVMGMTEPKAMEADQFKTAENQLDVQGPLFNYREKGSTLEYIGKETLPGGDAHKLKITFKNGESSHIFIDAKTNMVVKISGQRSMNGQTMEIETSYSDYKQNGDGYWFAYTTDTSQGSITYDKIESNVPADENMFKN